MEEEEEKLSFFSNFDIAQIQNERAKEKFSRQKLDLVRKLYLKTRQVNNIYNKNKLGTDLNQ